MSRLFLRFVALLMICFSALIGVCLFAGRSGLVADSASVMDRSPCALPCVFDIVPGVTTQGDALTLLHGVAPNDFHLTSQNSLFFNIRDANNRLVRGELMFAPGNGVVSAARISTGGSRAYLWRLGDLFNAGLQPTHVFRSCNTNVFHLLLEFGNNIEVVVELRSTDSLQPETPVTLLHVSAKDANTLYRARADFGCRIETGWSGFARRWVYLRAPANNT